MTFMEHPMIIASQNVLLSNHVSESKTMFNSPFIAALAQSTVRYCHAMRVTGLHQYRV
jgi:hypothetical protein